jgi:hypothetical protein
MFVQSFRYVMMITLKAKKLQPVKPRLRQKVLKIVMTEPKILKKTRLFSMILIELSVDLVNKAKIIMSLMIKRVWMMQRYNRNTMKKT